MGNNKIYIGIIITLTLTAAGIGGYLLYKKKKDEAGGATVKTAEPSSPETKTTETETKAEQSKAESGNTDIAPPKLTGAKTCSLPVNLAGDMVWEYRKCDTFWQTRKKGSAGQWISLASNKEATSKLNAAFPKM